MRKVQLFDGSISQIVHQRQDPYLISRVEVPCEFSKYISDEI